MGQTVTSTVLRVAKPKSGTGKTGKTWHLHGYLLTSEKSPEGAWLNGFGRSANPGCGEGDTVEVELDDKTDAKGNPMVKSIKVLKKGTGKGWSSTSTKKSYTGATTQAFDIRVGRSMNNAVTMLTSFSKEAFTVTEVANLALELVKAEEALITKLTAPKATTTETTAEAVNEETSVTDTDTKEEFHDDIPF